MQHRTCQGEINLAGGNGGASLLLDIRGAAALLGITPWQVRALISNGSLKIVKVGRKFYFRRATLVRWTERAEEIAA
jgi:excisionase family DNA binding protein